MLLISTDSSSRMRLGCWLVFAGCFSLTAGIEPISTSIAVGMAAALTGFLASYQNVLYYFHECCRPEWISYNKTGLNGRFCHICSRIGRFFTVYGYMDVRMIQCWSYDNLEIHISLILKCIKPTFIFIYINQVPTFECQTNRQARTCRIYSL